MIRSPTSKANLTLNDATLSEIEARLGYVFVQKQRLRRALIHASCPGRKDNDRLEFLGDRVLGLLTAAYLHKEEKERSTGDTADAYNALVDKASCAEAADFFCLSPYLQLGKSERYSGGREKIALCADAMEAVLGAAFLDGGYAAAGTIFARFWHAKAQAQPLSSKDAKTMLQEWAQKRSLPVPCYRVQGKSGPDHAPRFVIALLVEGYEMLCAEGKTKRGAEKNAAERFLKQEKIVLEQEHMLKQEKTIDAYKS